MRYLELGVEELHQSGPVALPLPLVVLLVGGEALQGPGLPL